MMSSNLRRGWVILTLTPSMFGFGLAGCASSEGPQSLTVSPGQYEAAFDAATEAARRQGMDPILRDRRGGVIETDEEIAGSIIEPWRLDNASFSQTVENTLSFQRRRARFEFAPAGFQPDSSVAISPDGQPLIGPDVLGGERAATDLTQHPGNLELRVWVYVERASTPGLRRSTWTRSLTTNTDLIAPEGQPVTDHATTYWTPVTRDSAFERRLLAEIQQSLALQSAAPSAN